jgi:tetratricopeptide (TPR) repeat protein
MTENMNVHANDAFTYTVNQNEYIAMYWLYQIVLFAAFSLTGYTGLTFLNVLLLSFIFYLVFYRMKSTGVPVWLASVTLFSAVVAMEFRFLYRPEIATWCCMLLMLIVLDEYFFDRRNRLFWLPVIQIFWVNLHGLFILGWVIIVAYFISILIHKKVFDKTFFKWSVISVLVSFINPYFFRGVVFPFYLFTRLQGSNIFKMMITELNSPWAIGTMGSKSLFLTAPIHWYYLISVTSLLFIIATYKRRKLHEYLLWTAFLFLSVTAVRNIPLFVIIAIQITAVSLIDIVAWIKQKLKNRRLFTKIKQISPVIVSLFIGLLCLRVMTNAHYLANNRANNFGVGLDRHAHPVGAADFINVNRLQERVLNDLNSGSWLIWQITQPVFIDGRLEVMQESFFEEYLSSFAENGLYKILREYNPRLITFEHGSALNWHHQLANMPEWRIIYVDEKSVIYTRQDYAVPIQSFSFTELLAQRDIDTTIDDAGVWQVLHTPVQSKTTNFLEGFFKRKSYSELLPMNLALFAYMNDEFRVSELIFLQLLKQTDSHAYQIYFNLGAVYYRREDYEKALYCYERVLDLDPKNGYAQKYKNDITEIIIQRDAF